MKEDAWDD